MERKVDVTSTTIDLRAKLSPSPECMGVLAECQGDVLICRSTIGIVDNLESEVATAIQRSIIHEICP
jgi:hypothetical protein